MATLEELFRKIKYQPLEEEQPIQNYTTSKPIVNNEFIQRIQEAISPQQKDKSTKKGKSVKKNFFGGFLDMMNSYNPYIYNTYAINNLLQPPATQRQPVVAQQQTVYQPTAQPSVIQSAQEQLPEGSYKELGGYKVPIAFLNLGWKQEAGTNYGELTEKARKGIVVIGGDGKADNKAGAKTYGPGLLYHPETGKLMQDMEPAGGFTTQELTRLYEVLLTKQMNRAREVGCKTWGQAMAYSGISGNFGSNSPVTKQLEQMIKENKSDDEISNFIAHASDSQRRQFPGLVTRRMWEARLWKGDFDAGGSHSEENRQITQQLNPG